MDEETDVGVGVMEKRAHTPRRYLDQYISSRASADMQVLGLFPNAKEVTESFGALAAARKHIPWGPEDPVTVICPGDGVTPRTATTFAFFTPWECISVDPELRDGPWDQVRRLTVVRAPVEDIALIRAELALVVAVHSHANLDAACARVRAREIAVIAIPCCVDQVWGNRPWMAYRDRAILSPKNEVRVWGPE